MSNATPTPAAVLRLARESESGFWTNGRARVKADRFAGFWQYDVGTMAQLYAYGGPSEVLPSLTALLARPVGDES